MTLKRIGPLDIEHFTSDFVKKSKCYEEMPFGCEIFGIYEGKELVGYFATLCYTNRSVDIVHGYLKPSARHSGKPKQAMDLLEQKIKAAGMKRIHIATTRKHKSYIKFMDSLGYNLAELQFVKEVN